MFRPEQIRSRNAKFDPDKIDSARLDAMNDLAIALSGRMA
jgi:hypothetical protein